MRALEMVKLADLMKLTSGSPAVAVGLIDGPVAKNHPDLATHQLRDVGANPACSPSNSTACIHGTCVAGILFAKRSSSSPGICPDCTLLVRPVFAESTSSQGDLPSATPDELASALVDCIDAGARVLNLSLALARPSSKGGRAVEQGLDYAAKRGVIVVAAAGNQGTIGSTAITRHPWVIPVTAGNPQGRSVSYTNLGRSIGRQGLCGPGESVVSLASGGGTTTFGGTSVAAPFVTGAIALLWSLFPNVSAAHMKLAVLQAGIVPRRSIAPPLLDAWSAYQVLANAGTKSARPTTYA